jgi:hypothetical protein
MSELDQIISIQITRETTPVSTVSFQIPLILSTHTKFAERARVYTDFDAIAADFDSVDKVYVIAQRIFGQAGARVPSVVVGRRQVDEVTITPTVANNTTYTVTINGTDYSYVSDSDAIASEITAGLATAIGALAGITVTDNLGTLTVEVTTPGTAWSIAVSSNLTKVDTAPTETWVEALDAVTEVNNTWYALVAETHVQADVEALAAAIQTRRKIYGTSTQNPAVPTTATTDIASFLDAGNYGRTFCVYLPTADTEYPEAAWIGSQLAYTPGSNTWNFKRGALVTVSNLTDTQRVNLRNKNCNMYTEVGGVDIFQDSVMGDGLFIDEQIVVDWTYARLQEQIFFRLINTLKVPMTNPGLTIIENEIRSVLSQGEANGAFDRGWTVTTPDVLSIPQNLRAQRIAGAFKFRARLAGAVHKIVIEGFLGI